MYAKGAVLGRLTADPELKHTNNGKAVVNFSLAHNPTRDGEPEYFDVTAWGQVAESVAAHKKKGDLVLASGRLQQQRWQQDGQNRSKVVLQANEVVFVSNKGENAPKADSGSDASEFGSDIPF